ncbi:MAG TPA: flagellar biosynthesis protein FlhA [Candidatus Ruthenibacterium merdavium]|uniref:Flagellar biosynthesis protein FlhA n=1 Tax=Candidatus Ruthenibacterium merdavium TaxID=2838752 RepID=A0A9D2Q8D7_9FIRM|nr:flagellar biosynthesis protein FlhA [Candidatus Ruthenibacterium merdavium]
MKIFNNIISIFVIVIVALLIVPLSTPILDFMFIMNLALSLVILLLTMYVRETLDLAIFPSLLLVTTLARLALNVSSTRSILSNNGYAGEVVKTFGQFVIRGNVVVGLVIFLIIVLVQFIVITKGAERVSEVSARFTLDAMPGKQMAIDADLSSGMIDEEQARARRLKIQKEADFFGAMDGASKFVKGDAIISIVITVVNLIGGVAIGFMNGGDFQTVLSTYSISTVGDGLMSQIPALLISVATGMLVTRSTSDADLNTDVIQQFTKQPMVLMIAGAVMPFLILIGFPPIQVLLIAVTLVGGGLIIYRMEKRQTEEVPEAPAVMEEVTSEVDYYKNLDNVYALLTVDPICIEVGYSLLPLVDQNSGGRFMDRIVMLRKQFADELGIVIPPVRMRDSSQINPNQYEVKLKGETVAIGEVLVDHYLALAPGALAPGDEIDGIDTVEPAFGMPAKWISDDKRVKAEMAGYTLIDATSVIVTHLSELIRAHAYELLTRQEVKKMLENLKKTNPTIVEETVPSVISQNELQKVLRNLLRESVPISDMETILETLADYAPTVKDSDILTEYVRQALKRTITHRFSEAGQLKVLSLDSEIENKIINSVKKMEGGAYLALDPAIIQKIVASTTKKVEEMRQMVQVPIILTSPIVRVYYKKMLDQFCPNVVVLSFNDVDSSVQIQSLGVIAL